MSWATWRQYRYPSGLAAALFVALGVVLTITGLHAALVWHSALARCAKDDACASLAGSNLSLSDPIIASLVVATAAVPLLPGLFLGAPMVAHELEAGTHQFAWTQSITRWRWLAVKAGWLLLASAVLAGAVSALVTWWSGPDNSLTADGFQINRFDVTGIVPVGYAIFAMALGICAGALLRRSLPALAVTLAGFVGLRALIALWLRLHFMTPVTAYYKLTEPLTPQGSFLGVSQGFIGPNGQPVALNYNVPNDNGVPMPTACQHLTSPDPQAVLPCVAAHGYRGYLSYQPATRFWAFQGIETGIYVLLAAALIGATFWVLKRRDA